MKRRQYVKVKIRIANEKDKFVGHMISFALTPIKRGKDVIYSLCKRDGELKDHIILARSKDVVCEKPATMNLKYGGLETIN